MPVSTKLPFLRSISRAALAAGIIFNLSLSCFGTDFLVTSASHIASTLPNVQPGDTLVMANGVWTNQQIQFAAMGTAAMPITLRAETPGGVTLNGNSSLNISGDWLVADGLRFDGGALGSSDHIVEFRGSLGHATNSRFTNSAILDYNPSDINTRYFWVSMYGENNRVDNNTFRGQNHSGVTVTVWRDNSDADNHRIDANHFLDRPEGNGNGFETIRIGTSAESLSSSFTTVENNLFERTDGEIEIISNKSGNNTFQYNTFRESAGTLTLRHGNDNLVTGNFFLGENKNESGGVRVIGEDQTITNNYFANLDGRANGAISISAAVQNSELNEYFQVKNAIIAHNTIVDVNDAAITFSDGLGSSNRTLLAEDVTIANNLIDSSQDALFSGSEGSGWTWEGNIAYGQSLGPANGNPGISTVNPQLGLTPDGLWRLGSNSPAIDAAAGGYGFIVDDMDGQARTGAYDIGADEFSTASIVRVPLSNGDVGAGWFYDPVDPPSNPCGVGCVSVQAEGFSSSIDPDGDGNKWTIMSDPDAFGGQNITAPTGSRTDLDAGDPHDALVTYDLVFDDAGVYTAYYRARGFDSSTDSLFTPDDFGVDPDNNESLSSNGIYRWEVGQSFQITSSDVGIPLQFRIGKREQLANLDVFVFHVNPFLTPAELDAIFLSAPDADFDNDGLINCADVDALVATIAGATNDTTYDLTNDGLVNGDDLVMWLADAGAANLASGNPYLPGDANLDGVVNGADFIIWNNNKFQTAAAWCSGDFNADGFVNGADFIIWNNFKFTSSDIASVPEPATLASLFALLLGVAIGRRRAR
jgi:poly(beta-D-mannuronate) lyase